ncbi:MAG: hypothetical protein HEP71_01655 [Roseivirga sp.]|nr:hypothetical protein [Roseivirga sp.]
MKKLLSNLVLATLIVVFLSCGGNDGDIVVDTATYEGTININPNNFPAGAGLDMSEGDTGRVAQLDAEPNLPWDLMIITYRTAAGGRPGFLLFGDETSNSSVKAINISEHSGIGTGLAGFNAFTRVDQTMTSNLQADGVFNFNPVTDVDGQGRADGTILQAAYDALVIGNRIVNLASADQPVYLVATREGFLYKFQMVERVSGGQTTLRWARFSNDAIN